MRRCCLWIGVCLSLALSAWAVWADEDAGQGGPKVRVRPLTYVFADRNVPLPVLVTLENEAEEFCGVLEARVGRGTAGHVWRSAVRTGRGRFRFFLYPQVRRDRSEDTVFVRVLDDRGRALSEQSIPLRFNRKLLSVLSVMGPDRTFSTQDLGVDFVSVARIRRCEDLPDEWYGYRGFDVLLWDTYVAESLSPVQETALADWIRAGGRLILAAKAEDAHLCSPLPSVAPVLTRDVAGAGPKDVVAVREFPADADALFAEQRVGQGSIVWLRRDFNALSGWSKDAILRLLGCGDVSAAAPPAELRAWDVYRRFNNLFEPEAVLRSAVARLGGFTAIDFRPILITMLVYILLVSLGDYCVLRRFRKLPWTWATFPALILGFSVLSFRLFYQGELGTLVRHEFMFSDAGPDGGMRCRTLSCIRNNRNRPITFSVGAGHYLAPFREADSRYSSGRGRPAPARVGGLTETRGTGGTKTVSIPAYVGSYRFFREEWVRKNVAPPFECRVQRDGEGTLTGGFVQRADAEVFKAFLLHDGRRYKLNAALAVPERPMRYKGGTIDASSYLRELDWIRRANTHKDPVQVFVSYVWKELSRPALCRRPFDLPPQVERRVLPAIPSELLGAGEALLIAFTKEKTQVAGMQVNRIRCIRQIIRIGGEAK